MRILCLIDSLAPAGAERSLAHLVPHFVSAGLSVDVAFLWDRPGLHGELRSAGARVFSLAGPGGRPARLVRAVRLMRRLRPDLIHTSLFDAHVIGRVAARLAGIPVASTWTGVSYGIEHRRAPHLKSWKVDASRIADLATARLVARFHAVSEHVARVMAARLHVRPERVEVVPRGRDRVWLGERSEARRSAARASLGVSGEERLVLAVARHDYKKGLDTLVEAFAALRGGDPAIRLFVAGGEGHDTHALHRLAAARALDGSVVFLGARPDIPELLCAADVFALPSRSEGFPGVLLEAMALQVPIVASDLPAVREITGGEQVARLVPSGDAAAFAGAIAGIFSEPLEAAGRARAARERFIERFGIESIAKQMMEFYAQALSESGSKRR